MTLVIQMLLLNWHTEIFSIYSTKLINFNNQFFIDRTVSQARLHHGKLHPPWDIGWGNTSFDINAFKAHSKQKDIKQDDCIHYGTLDEAILILISMLLRLILNKRTLNRAILFLSQCFCSSFKTMCGLFSSRKAF